MKISAGAGGAAEAVSRSRALNNIKGLNSGPVVYWMSRDQRVEDNWALLHACQLAEERPVVVAFTLVKNFLGAGEKHYRFMIEGLRQTAENLAAQNIPFVLLQGAPEQRIGSLLNFLGASALVCDFSPLRLPRLWKRRMARNLKIPFVEVDAHNIVPCWLASEKQEFSARTFRPKILRLLPKFLTEIPRVKKRAGGQLLLPKSLAGRYGFTLPPRQRAIGGLKPGEQEAVSKLRRFLKEKIGRYTQKDDPAAEAQSGLSPYLHFGQLAAQRVALETMRLAESAATEQFLEQLIVRKELAENFCHYNPHYDSFLGLPAWASRTLSRHAMDPRPHLYTLKRLEAGKTADQLWNAAQLEMVNTGKMHGYLRMYWAKQILAWSPTPALAMRRAIYLNDKYSLDGRDPNGYAGIAWSIGGVHDRPWFERKIFGSVRYMSANGAKKKFDTEKYINNSFTIKPEI